MFKLSVRSCYLYWALLGQLIYSQQVEIIGEVSEGRVEEELRPNFQRYDFEVESSKTLVSGGARVTINKLSKPASVLSDKQEMAVQEVEAAGAIEELKSCAVTVSAEIYGHQFTKLELRRVEGARETEALIVWSNVDWNHFGGFTSIKTGGTLFSYILLSADRSIEEMGTSEAGKPEGLKPMSEVGPRCYVMGGDVEDAELLNFLESIHELQAQRGEFLKNAYEKRMMNQAIAAQKELEKQGQLKEVELYFWKKK